MLLVLQAFLAAYVVNGTYDYEVEALSRTGVRAECHLFTPQLVSRVFPHGTGRSPTFKMQCPAHSADSVRHTRLSDRGEVTAAVACAEVGTLSLAGATFVRIYHGPFGRARDT